MWSEKRWQDPLPSDPLANDSWDTRYNNYKRDLVGYIIIIMSLFMI